MLREIARRGIIGFIFVYLCITQPAEAEELVRIPRTEKKAYCPTFYNSKVCEGDKEQCILGVLTRLPTPTPTSTPTPTPLLLAASEGQAPSSQPAEQSPPDKPASLNADLIFEMINAHRASIGLPAYQKEEKLCALARERGPELYNEIFVTGDIHGGMRARNLPYWITENMKHGPNEQEVISWWLNSPIHRKGIEGNFVYSCGECWGNSCAQLFTSYQAK